MAGRSVVVVGTSGNDSLEVWRCEGSQMRPFLTRGDAVPNMVARMIESGDYDVESTEGDGVWCVEIKEKHNGGGNGGR